MRWKTITTSIIITSIDEGWIRELTEVLLKELDEIIKKNIISSSIFSSIKEIGSSVSTESVVLFDLVGSSKTKIEQGHDWGIELVVFHNLICRSVIGKFDGRVVKETGDGILSRFKDPHKACLAALNFKEAMIRRNLATKIILSLGIVEDIKVKGWSDIMGSTVDKCSKVEKLAMPNQILIDRALHDAVESLLKNYKEITISKPMPITLEEYGKLDFYEISLTKDGLHNCLNRKNMQCDPADLVTTIITFDVEPHNQQRLVEALVKFEEAMRKEEGIISIKLQKVLNGNRIISNIECDYHKDIQKIFENTTIKSCLEAASTISKPNICFYQSVQPKNSRGNLSNP